MRPHVVLFARFGGESNESAPAVRLDWLTDELTGAGASVLDDDRSVSIDFSGVEVDFFVSDQASGADYQATARARLEALDTDSNGYLDTEEFSAAMMQFMAPFEAVDQDRDQQINLAEITSFMKQKQASARSQIVIAAGPVEDALFSALDGDNDARLDERELAEVGRRLNALDADLDGQVSVDEIPLKLSIRIIRGLPQMGQAQYARPPAAPNVPAAEVPRWFVRMDANGDGAISRREFLGTSEQFEELDLDDDDFVESDEAQQPPASR
jgi:Ca2+-binding EF-hand superfamily protein